MVGIPGLQELRKGADDDLKRINGEGNVAKAVLTIVESHKARLASLREHVEGLVKGGGGSMADLELVAAGIRAMEELDTADAKKVASAVVTGTAAEADAEAIAEPQGEAEGEADGEADGEAKPEAEAHAAAEQTEQAPAARTPTTAAKRKEQASTKKS